MGFTMLLTLCLTRSKKLSVLYVGYIIVKVLFFQLLREMEDVVNGNHGAPSEAHQQVMWLTV